MKTIFALVNVQIFSPACDYSETRRYLFSGCCGTPHKTEECLSAIVLSLIMYSLTHKPELVLVPHVVVVFYLFA